MRTTAQPAARVRLRPIALPSEHGGWGFLLEPILLGLLVAPTLAGLCMGVAAAGAFLIEQPLQLAISDHRKGKRFPRTAVAERLALGYALVAAVAFALSIKIAAHPFWLPLLAALPLAGVRLGAKVMHQARAALPEMAGALALGATAPMMALAAGWPVERAFVLWGLLALRAIPAIIYVRAGIRRARGQAAGSMPALAAHAAALVLGVALLAQQLIPWLALVALVLLLIRAGVVLSRTKPPPARIIGMQELAFGALTVALFALGLRLG